MGGARLLFLIFLFLSVIPTITIYMNQFDHLPPLSVSSINCNSLNISVTSKQNQIWKIYGIVKLKTDIIFLSDVCICNRNLVNGISDILRVFQINPYQSYNFVYNSSSNKRGVGMYTY